ncbi:SidA/IucD/PvdA family monooxygenase [Streptomyces sp. NPDC001340]
MLTPGQSQRNPVSPLSFVAYLSAQGRLSDFINHQTLFPTRIEFHDYLEWAAGHSCWPLATPTS